MQTVPCSSSCKQNSLETTFVQCNEKRLPAIGVKQATGLAETPARQNKLRNYSSESSTGYCRPMLVHYFSLTLALAVIVQLQMLSRYSVSDQMPASWKWLAAAEARGLATGLHAKKKFPGFNKLTRPALASLLLALLLVCAALAAASAVGCCCCARLINNNNNHSL
jgi:hypothetical protein